MGVPRPSRRPLTRPGCTIQLPRPQGPTGTRTFCGVRKRAAVVIGTAFFVAALLVDAVGPGVTMARTAGWGCLAAVLLLVLLPPRISLTPGRLVVRDLFTTRVVLTDQLSALQRPADVSERVVLTDVRGTRAQPDLCLLRANPSLWLQLEADADESRRCGSLVRGTSCLDRLARRMDEEAARSVFRSSGID